MALVTCALRGEQIPIGARIFAVGILSDAMILRSSVSQVRCRFPLLARKSRDISGRQFDPRVGKFSYRTPGQGSGTDLPERIGDPFRLTLEHA